MISDKEKTNKNEFDVEDRLDLLEEMIADEKSAPEMFRATNFWEFYEKDFLPELKQQGLRSFRSRRNSVLENFFATSLRPEPHIPVAGPAWLPESIRRTAGRLRYGNVNETEEREELFRARFAEVNDRGRQAGVRLLSDISTSLAGCPEDVFSIDGRHYTFSTLYYYSQYVWAAGLTDFSKINTVVELGSGAGFFAEILKKLHPHLTILLFDLAPQLYVCSSYLAKSLAAEFVGYRESKSFQRPCDVPQGKVAVFGAYRFPIITNDPVDLFWNSASFQEMEPNVVQNYLGYVRKSSKMIYLREMTKGQLQSDRKGELGVLKKTGYSVYVNELKGEYDLLEILPSWMNCIRYPEFATVHDLALIDGFWKRSNA